MKITLPTWLTLLRIALLPVVVVAFYLPYHWANEVVVVLFILAGITDGLDGWLARRTGQQSGFGAFLDPVADKLMVAVALVIVLERHPSILLGLAVAVIIGREITVSALREWMSEIGARAHVKVNLLGKIKTIFQMVAIGFLLYGAPLWGLPILAIGLWLLVAAAGLTLWSMLMYLAAAWPILRAHQQPGSPPGG